MALRQPGTLQEGDRAAGAVPKTKHLADICRMTRWNAGHLSVTGRKEHGAQPVEKNE